jgi:hypothetical protein
MKISLKKDENKLKFGKKKSMKWWKKGKKNTQDESRKWAHTGPPLERKKRDWKEKTDVNKEQYLFKRKHGRGANP